MMAARRRPRGRAKPIRSQPRDPVTGERRSIYAESEAERDARLLQLDRVRRDVRYGLDPNEATKFARPALGRVLTTNEVWSRYAGSKRDRARRKADGYWRSYIEPYLGARKVWELTADVMAHWVLDLGRTRGRTGHGLSPASIWLCYDYIAAACNRVVPRELPGLPWGTWRPEVPRGEDGRVSRREYATSIEELRAIVLQARIEDEKAWRSGHFADLTNRLVVFLLTGMRQAEVAGLAWDMVAIDGQTPLLHIWAQAPAGWRNDWLGHDRPPQIPKGRRRRRQVMHPNVVDALRSQRDQLQAAGRYREDGPVFPGHGSEWRNSGRVIAPDRIRGLARAAGLPNPHLWVTHSTRHSFASLEIHASLGDFRATKERTGHSTISQLEGYYHSGRGMPQSQIPALTPEAIQPAIQSEGHALADEPVKGQSDCPPQLPAPEKRQPPEKRPSDLPEQPSPAAIVRAEPTGLPQRPRGRPKVESARSYTEHAREWLTALQGGHVPQGRNGRALVRPEAVTEDVRRHQRRVSARFRGKVPGEQLAKKVAAARRAKLAAWARALKLAAKN